MSRFDLLGIITCRHKQAWYKDSHNWAGFGIYSVLTFRFKSTLKTIWESSCSLVISDKNGWKEKFSLFGFPRENKFFGTPVKHRNLICKHSLTTPLCQDLINSTCGKWVLVCLLKKHKTNFHTLNWNICKLKQRAIREALMSKKR